MKSLPIGTASLRPVLLGHFYHPAARGAKLLVVLLTLMLLGATAQAQTPTPPPRPLIQLNLQPISGQPDETNIYFEAGATTGFDGAFDATKLPNTSGLNLASLIKSEQLSINGLPPALLAAPFTVRLFVGVPSFDTYNLEVIQLVDFTSTDVFLTDSIANTSTLLTPTTIYPFDVTAANTNGTYTSTRFSLVFQPNGNPLPVTLTDFTAHAQPPGVALAWHTANEQHSAYFAIERSADGQLFTEIGRVAAAGTTSQAHSYTFYDSQALGGTGYYRLRQVDVGGTFQYSPVRAVGGQLAAVGLNVFPNPAHAGSIVRGVSPGAQVQVFDALGRVVATAQADASGTFVLPVGLPSGMYVVRGGQESSRLAIE